MKTAPAPSILIIEPDPIYRQVFGKIFADSRYRLRFAELNRLEEECRNCQEDLLFASLELPGKSIFSYYPLIRQHRTDLPLLLFTNEDMNEYLEDLINTEQTNVLTKPFTREELLFFLDKLLNKQRAFGLKNYLKPGSTVKTFFINRSGQVRDTVQKLLEIGQGWGFNFDYDFKIDLVLHELLINALYHAYGYEDEKVQGRQIVLPEGEEVEVEVGHDENRFGVTITDYCGTLTRDRILHSLQRLQAENAADELLAEGARISEVFKQHGRGIDIVRKNSGEYYFVIDRNNRTQAVIIFDKNFEKDDEFTSLKILEV